MKFAIYVRRHFTPSLRAKRSNPAFLNDKQSWIASSLRSLAQNAFVFFAGNDGICAKLS
jgi:hypothetical protein